MGPDVWSVLANFIMLTGFIVFIIYSAPLVISNSPKAWPGVLAGLGLCIVGGLFGWHHRNDWEQDVMATLRAHEQEAKLVAQLPTATVRVTTLNGRVIAGQVLGGVGTCDLAELLPGNGLARVKLAGQWVNGAQVRQVEVQPGEQAVVERARQVGLDCSPTAGPLSVVVQ